MKLAFTLLAALFLMAAASAEPNGVMLIGLDGVTKTVTAAEIAAMPHQSAELNDHGKAVRYSGVSLGDIVALVGAPRGDALRGRAFVIVVVAEASDGYRVVLTLADVDPIFRKAPLILADNSEGKPLESHEGPFRLIVAGDDRPARSARNVVTIRLVTVN